MRRSIFAACVAALPLGAAAGVVETALDDHILPRVQELAAATAQLARVAGDDCTGVSKPLRAAYTAAFDAWVAISHLRFGPTEVGDRAFALAFWPDSRGATPKSLKSLIHDADPVAQDPELYQDVSIAARGYYALEYMLFDDEISKSGDAEYRCLLVQTITVDMANTTGAILADSTSGYAELLRSPSAAGPYRSRQEVEQALFKALGTGLQFTAETRLGRPMGTFERPRPKRAEAWRSDRAARHVALSLNATHDLAIILAGDDAVLLAGLNADFAKASAQLSNMNDPAFANVVTPQGRLRVEVLQQAIEAIRARVTNELGPHLGVTAGFNSLDGD